MPRVSRINKELVLINDADSSVYAIGFMTEHKEHFLYDAKGHIVLQGKDKKKFNIEWKKLDPDKTELTYDLTVDVDPVNYALSSCKKFVHNTLEFTGCSRMILLLTKGGNCFRHNLATIQKYKGNRTNKPKPVHYDAMRQYYMDNYTCMMYDKWEADDAACMALHKGSGIDGVDYIMSSIDKDLEQQIGRHINPSKKEEGVYVLEEVECWYNFYHQMLCGDTADNIKGLKGTRKAPGISKAKASKILAKAGDNITLMCQVVYDEYLIRYGEQPFAYVPWWMDTEKFPDNEFIGVKPDTLTGTALTMFRENADLLYMLRTPTDQYLPHCRTLLDQWDKYPTGTVDYFLPVEEDDDAED